MRKLGDVTNIWNTIREPNVAEIREEAEQQVRIALIGEPDARSAVAHALRGQPGRFPAAHRGALAEFDLPLRLDRSDELRGASLLVLALHGNRPLPDELERAADRLSLVPAPAVVVCIGADRLPPGERAEAAALNLLPVVATPPTEASNFAEQVSSRLAEHVPEDLRMAAARSLPGLRHAVANAIVADTSLSNATYALTSGIPEMIPVLNLPLNAADLVVLTKNQALMVYRIALAFGAPGDFQAQMREIMPVIGGGFAWRQVARQLIGLVPGFGLLPKVAVAYGGTYATGQAALVWYSRGEVLSRAALNRLYRQAIITGRERARALLARRKQDRPYTRDTRRLSAARRGIRRFLPGGRTPPPPPEN